MKWERVDDWHMRNGDWTMTWAPKALLPFGLYHNGVHKGHFETNKATNEEFKKHQPREEAK
jgi:hypothetical protein